MKRITLLLLFSIVTFVATAQINISYIMSKPIFVEYIKNDTTIVPSEPSNYYFVTKNPVTINIPAPTDSLAANSPMFFLVADSVMTINFNHPIYARSGGANVSTYTLSETGTYPAFFLYKFYVFEISIWDGKWRINGHRPK